MKKIIYKHTPLYRFLSICNDEKENSMKVLDCGAGGDTPPLGMFYEAGFTTYGVELDVNQVERANNFSLNNGQLLNIQLGDMTSLEFEDNSFDFVYSYNSIFHMKKSEIEKSLIEMKRVLKTNGLMFVNFLSEDDFRFGEGPHLGKNQYEQMDDEPVIHSYYLHNEADKYFEDMHFLVKERRVIERIYQGEKIRQGFIDYIVRK